MRKKILLTPVGIVLGVLAAAISFAADPTPKVFAKVGSITIEEQDVQREIQRRVPMQVSFHGGIKPEKLEQIRKEAEAAVVERAYKVQYALEKELSVDAKDVDSEWSAALAKNPGIAGSSPQELAKLKAMLYFELLAKKSEDVAVSKQVVVSDEEVKEYYEKNRNQFFQPKLFKASHVFVKVDPAETVEEKAAKRQKADKLMERAKSGEDFYNLAYYESDDRSRYVGGSLGSFHTGQTVREFDAALQQLKPGEIAGPVKTLYGYHIIKLDDVQEGRQLTFDQASAKIRSTLTEGKRKKLYEDWMNALRQKYPLQNPAN